MARDASRAPCPPESWSVDQCLTKLFVEERETRTAGTIHVLGEVARLGNDGRYKEAIEKAEAMNDLQHLFVEQKTAAMERIVKEMRTLYFKT